MDWIVRPIRAVFFADEQAFNWIQKKLGLSKLSDGLPCVGERSHHWPVAGLVAALKVLLNAAFRLRVSTG